MKHPPFPKIHHIGTYILRCGPYFYLGSSHNIQGRRAEHRRLLHLGEHPNQTLQKAFEDHGREITFDLLHSVHWKQFPLGADLTKHLRALEQTLLDFFHGDPFCCNRSSTSVGVTCKRPDVVARWQDPAFREKMRGVSRDYERTPEIREKLAAAKRGGRNPHAKAVWTLFRGERLDFPSCTEAAAHFGVTQQCMDGWMRGLNKWPGTGKKPPRGSRSKELVGLTGGFVDPVDGIL